LLTEVLKRMIRDLVNDREWFPGDFNFLELAGSDRFSRIFSNRTARERSHCQNPSNTNQNL
jgi:hypothetical protein